MTVNRIQGVSGRCDELAHAPHSVSDRVGLFLVESNALKVDGAGKVEGHLGSPLNAFDGVRRENASVSQSFDDCSQCVERGAPASVIHSYSLSSVGCSTTMADGAAESICGTESAEA